MHYSIQITLGDLEAACIEHFEEGQWVKQWHPQGGSLYIGRYPSGQAVISGPMTIGNPNAPWFEIQCTDPAILTDIQANETLTMREHLRTSALARAWYKNVSGRRPIRNSRGVPVGITPAFVICGTDPAGSFLGDDDIELAQELPDLE